MKLASASMARMRQRIEVGPVFIVIDCAFKAWSSCCLI